jgi:phage anti-repressor protein
LSKTNGPGQRTVNARDLWEFLGSKQNFSHWIRNRIKKYGFAEEADFWIILSKINRRGRPTHEYHLTLGMFKGWR